MTNTASDLRKAAQRISNLRAEADSQATGLHWRAERMSNAGIYGVLDVQQARETAEEAAARADDLAEQEYHAWAAYEDASQAEYFDYLAEQEDAANQAEDAWMEAAYEDRYDL